MNWNQFYDTRVRVPWDFRWSPFGESFIHEYKVRNRLKYPLWVNRFYIPPKSSILIPAAYLGNGVNIFGARGVVTHVYFPLVGGSIGCGSAQGKVTSRTKTCDHYQARLRVKYRQRFNHSDEITISSL